ncbi:hypothetical protein JCM6882_004753 [Rhodosporidiobolus microsporus]
MSDAASPHTVKQELNGNARARARSPARSDNEDGSEPSDDQHQAKRIKRDAKGKGRAVVQDDEDEADADEQDGDAADEDEDDDEDREEEKVDLSLEKQQLVRDDSGYVTGSIVRIACHSFLTYDSVEFRPGPALNMIIGPNGTGKSTIACAIAIGLGFPAKVLGRSTKLAQYCKNDSNEETWIEIELKGRPGKKNLIVKRILSRDSESTKFFLNGNAAGVKEVAEHMEELQVQVGNLCTFLPQDRVASFAMMSASELLKETQKAAGHAQLSQWHEILIKEYKTSKEAQGEVDRLAEKLKRMQTKQAETEKEVRAFEQRERLEQDLAVVDILVKFAQYMDIYNRLQVARQEKTRVQNEVKELEAKNQPFKDSKDLLEMIVAKSADEQKQLTKQVDRATKDAASKQKAIQATSDEHEEVAQAIDDIKKNEEQRRETIRKHESDIRKYQALVDNEPPEADTSDISRQVADKFTEYRAIDAEIQENNDRGGGVMRQNEQLKRDMEHQQKTLQTLQQVAKIRENNCRQYDSDTWAATEWLRANKHRMQGQVFEPARFNIFPKKHFNGQSLDNKALLNVIEGPIPMSAFSTFLFEYRADYDFMFDELVDRPQRERTGRSLRINGAEIDGNQRLADVPRPLSSEQLTALGLDAYTIDLLDGPEPVLVWLCAAHQLARVPVQLFRRPLDTAGIERSRVVQRYYTLEGSASIRVSNYGRRVSQLEHRQLDWAKILAGGVDQGRVDACNERIQEIVQERQTLKTHFEKLQAATEDLKAQQAQIKEEAAELKREKDRMTQARGTWQKAKARLNAAQASLEKEKKKPSAEQKRAKLTDRLKGIVEKRVRLALEYKDLVDRAADKQEQAIKVHLQALQAECDHNAMQAVVKEKDQELVNKQKELDEAKIQVAALRDEGHVLLAIANQAQEEASGELEDRVLARKGDNFEAISIDELEQERDQLQSNLNCMTSVSPVVLEAYNKRKGEISEYEGKLGLAQEKLDDSNELIAATKNRWLPRLENLVKDVSAKFTASFDTLGLLGEVRLAQQEDYDKWGIEILVSFRDSTDDSTDVTLHVLSGHRQSGGERALTTVTYLLALAELARAPFALVDEINQGMDQRAERNMHKMLVETTCKDDVGQYFLLTPKLLPDLVYHPKMKVLVINVSPWLPSALNLRDIVKQKKRLNKGERPGRAIAAA